MIDNDTVHKILGLDIMDNRFQSMTMLVLFIYLSISSLVATMGTSDSSLIDTTLQSTRDVNIKILYTEASTAAIIDSYLSMIY